MHCLLAISARSHPGEQTARCLGQIQVIPGIAIAVAPPRHPDAMGRPVGVAVDKHGALLVADVVGNTMWRVSTSTRLTDNR